MKTLSDISQSLNKSNLENNRVDIEKICVYEVSMKGKEIVNKEMTDAVYKVKHVFLRRKLISVIH